MDLKATPPPGTPGADPTLPVLSQRWIIPAFPPAEELAALVDALDATMAIPLRRFAFHDERLRSVNGSWQRSRDKALRLVEGGHKGVPLAYISVISYNHGGYNWFPDSAVSFDHPMNDTGTGMLPDVCLLIERILRGSDDPLALARSWTKICASRLPQANVPVRTTLGPRDGSGVEELQHVL